MTADKQLKAYIDRVLRLKEEQDALSDDIREVYAEAKADGYDKTVMGKLVAHLRKVLKQGDGAVAEAESIFDTYLNAYHRASGTAVATHTHEENYDPETGEILEDIKPRLSKRIVDGMQTEAGRAALIAAVDIMIEQEQAEEEFRAKAGEEANTTMRVASNDPVSRTDDVRERQHASTVELADDCITGGKEQSAAAAAPAGDAAACVHGIPVNSKADAAISRPEFDRPEIANRSDEEASVSNASGEMQDEGAIHLPTISEIASAPQGEAEAPAPTDVSLPEDDGLSGEGANAGGDHEVANQPAATYQAGALVNQAPAPDGIVFETVPPTPMKTLGYSHCFPELSKTEYQCLAGDIALNGVLEPIVRMGDIIVDGWNRYNAARSLGIEYPVKKYSGDDVLLDVIKWQRASRDWTSQQERKIAAALAKAVPHRSDDIAAAFHLVDEEEPA